MTRKKQKKKKEEETEDVYEYVHACLSSVCHIVSAAVDDIFQQKL